MLKPHSNPGLGLDIFIVLNYFLISQIFCIGSEDHFLPKCLEQRGHLFFSTEFFRFLIYFKNILGFDNVSKSAADNPQEFFKCDHLNIKNLQKSRIFQLILSISVKSPKYVEPSFISLCFSHS